jgi:hypothetical protein
MLEILCNSKSIKKELLEKILCFETIRRIENEKQNRIESLNDLSFLNESNIKNLINSNDYNESFDQTDNKMTKNGIENSNNNGQIKISIQATTLD